MGKWIPYLDNRGDYPIFHSKFDSKVKWVLEPAIHFLEQTKNKERYNYEFWTILDVNNIIELFQSNIYIKQTPLLLGSLKLFT